jgi:hypothetical protein
LPLPSFRDKPDLRASGRPTVPFSEQIALAAAASLLCAAAWASDDAIAPGTYDVTARTLMPNLEDNLRYAMTRERRCLRAHDLATVFPILRHHSLEGCTLGAETRRGATIGYALACASPQVATGSARLDTAPGRISGSLEIKMGGKNMTFSQRVEAVRRGDCAPPP